MHNAFVRRLLGTTLPVAMPQRYELNNAATVMRVPPPTGAEILVDLRKAVDALGPKPRGAGGQMLFETDPDMPSGWFGLREPGAPQLYAGPLPLSSFAIFYRGGDVVRLSPSDADALRARASAPPDQKGS